jgi:hypothetical protein
MIPIMKVEYSEVFANTRFFVELNKVLFGAELAMMYAGVPDVQKQEIKNRIMRSAFPDMDLDYAGMFMAANGNEMSDTVSLAPTPRFLETQGSPGADRSKTYTSSYPRREGSDDAQNPSTSHYMKNAVEETVSDADKYQYGESDSDSFGGESEYPPRSPFINHDDATDEHSKSESTEDYITE